MAVNYNDSRFQEVERDKNQALADVKNTYDQMINGSDQYFQDQINASKDWADKQNELQQAQTDFAIEKIEQQKDQTEKDYTKEQKAAYTDYLKATDQYGANAEKLASQGLTNTGYSESTRTNMYNTYQSRYASARETYNKAVLNYDNAIKEAQLANSSTMAKIAYEALQQQLQLSLQGFQYKNQLVLQKLDQVNQTEDRYYNRYQNVLNQINTENALAEQQRQFNEEMAFKKAEAAREQSNWEKQYNLSVANSRRSSSGSSSSKSSSSSGSSSTKLTNSASSGNSSSGSGGMSARARTLQVQVSALSRVDKGTAKNMLAAAYNNGAISESEFTTIANKMKF